MGGLFDLAGVWLASTNIDEVLGLVSSIVALLGVPWTLVQAGRARTAAEAARDAVERNARRRTLVEALRGLPGHVRELDDLLDRLAGADWKAHASVVRLIRRELVELQEHRASFTSDEHTMLQSAITSLLELELTFRNTDRIMVSEEQVSELRARLGDRTDELHRLQVRLQTRAIGDEHERP